MRERDVERYLVQRVKALGGEVRKVQWIGRCAAPDRLVMLPQETCTFVSKKDPTDKLKVSLPHDGGAIWVELKRPGLAATFPSNAHERAQFREHERMRAMGQRVVVIDSLDGVDGLLA